ncbi:MAG: cytochrome c [Pirellulaceae bacterium]|nr:MAG: cytochrome c [Pirellulaceae bacterium]
MKAAGTERLRAAWRSVVRSLLILATCILGQGCRQQEDAFPPNKVFAKRLELQQGVSVESAHKEVQLLLRALFGTPNQPRWPAAIAAADGQTPQSLVSLTRLERAAGAVRSNEEGVHWGLYREHCVACHGVAGNGLGPAAALLNPYPRDFQMGVFKWKRTPRGEKPTRDDLHRVLVRGVPGTAMPSFLHVDREDREALVDYTIYLAVRGEYERRLLQWAVTEVDWEGGEHLLPRQLLDAASGGEGAVAVESLDDELLRPLQQILQQWRRAEEDPLLLAVGDAPLPFSQDQEKALLSGAELFQGTVVGCAFCHGPDGKGAAQVNNFDDWTRDYTVMAGINPLDAEQLAPLLEAGALKPRPAMPRNLTWGIYRGGDELVDLMARITHGIDGTPMPSAPLQPQNPQGLNVEQLGDLVRFVRSLAGRDQGAGKGDWEPERGSMP